MSRFFFRITLVSIVVAAGCSGSTTPPVSSPNMFPAGMSSVPMRTADELSGGPCSVSNDGFVWYALQSGRLPPIDFSKADCTSPATIDGRANPAIPNWAKPSGSTQAIFVATSLQEAYSPIGMQAIARDAESVALPVTWMIGNATYLTSDAAYYNQLHASDGDDVELEESSELYSLAAQSLPWYAPAVSVEGAGRERQISEAQARGNGAFWGITWNSHGTDSTSDEGAPWGTFCSDPNSYKRPSPAGECSLLSFEWTARDLTRAYFADTSARGYSAEAAFSSDPDDVLQRGGFDAATAIQYEKSLVDAYAAGGVTAPIVMMNQQESVDEQLYGAADDPVLTAIYAEAKADGMKLLTLRDAMPAAKAFSGAPRAIAFPYIPGGMETDYNGAPFTPGTIDFHDSAAGMTFVSGHTLPARLYRYADDPVSTYNKALQETLPSDPTFPQLRGVVVSNHQLQFAFDAPAATHFGVAVWADPSTLGLSGSNVVAAGHAGAVIYFDLPAGLSTQTIGCASCTSTKFTFSN